MKTTGFRTIVLGTPWRNLTYCIIETDEGITGIGEARVLGKTHTVVEYLKDVERHFIGQDPFNIEALYRRMTLLDFGKPGEVVYTGLALVELAYWDIIGKFCNLLNISEASFKASLALLIGSFSSFNQSSNIGLDIVHIFVSGSSFLATPSTTTIVFCKSSNCI